MVTVDTVDIRASVEQVFAVAADVEQWPAVLAHYRWVRMLERRSDGGTVEMAAWRPFGLVKWPTWWRSEMWVDRPKFEVRYRHIAGITSGMDVVWRVTPTSAGSHVDLIHTWEGPPWPLIRYPAAHWVIGPVFVHGIASRSLAGIKRHLEQAHE